VFDETCEGAVWPQEYFEWVVEEGKEAAMKQIFQFGCSRPSGARRAGRIGRSGSPSR
jgi:hypothetical protein